MVGGEIEGPAVSHRLDSETFGVVSQAGQCVSRRIGYLLPVVRNSETDPFFSSHHRKYTIKSEGYVTVIAQRAGGGLRVAICKAMKLTEFKKK